MAKKIGPRITPASSEEALAFIRKMQQAFKKKPRTTQEKERLRTYLAKFSDAELKAVGARLQGDVLRRPPRTVKPGDLPRQRGGRGAAVKNASPVAAPRTRKAARRGRAD